MTFKGEATLCYRNYSQIPNITRLSKCKLDLCQRHALIERTRNNYWNDLSPKQVQESPREARKHAFEKEIFEQSGESWLVESTREERHPPVDTRKEGLWWLGLLIWLRSCILPLQVYWQKGFIIFHDFGKMSGENRPEQGRVTERKSQPKSNVTQCATLILSCLGCSVEWAN